MNSEKAIKEQRGGGLIKDASRQTASTGPWLQNLGEKTPFH
jgi:hypothetical protein